MKSKFAAVLESGHKGCAVIVPFDPSVEWGRPARPVFSKVYGKDMPGHPVRGTIAGAKFSGWVGQRWGRFFVLVDEALREAAGIAPGETVDVVLEPTDPGPADPTPSKRKPAPRRTVGRKRT